MLGRASSRLCCVLILLSGSMAVRAAPAQDASSSGTATWLFSSLGSTRPKPSREEFAKERKELIESQRKRGVPVDKDFPSPDGQYVVRFTIRAASDGWPDYCFDIWNRSTGRHDHPLEDVCPSGIKWLRNDRLVTVERVSHGLGVCLIRREGDAWTVTYVGPDIEQIRGHYLVSVGMQGRSIRFVFKAWRQFWDAKDQYFRVSFTLDADTGERSKETQEVITKKQFDALVPVSESPKWH